MQCQTNIHTSCSGTGQTEGTFLPHPVGKSLGLVANSPRIGYFIMKRPLLLDVYWDFNPKRSTSSPPLWNYKISISSQATCTIIAYMLVRSGFRINRSRSLWTNSAKAFLNLTQQLNLIDLSRFQLSTCYPSDQEGSSIDWSNTPHYTNQHPQHKR